ncbi:MAG: PilZ domain-containing protein [Desulfobacula sp.]|jgi:hypothetical protein
MNSLSPYSRSSIIYDIDLKKQTIIIAQPIIAFSKNTYFRELHLTTIVQEKNRKIRLGVQCEIFSLINQYPLANKTSVQAVALKYQLPVEETNIRSAFRLRLSTKSILKSNLLYGKLEYSSPKNFTIRDISLNGVGLVIPKTKNTQHNPFSEIKINDEIVLEIILMDADGEYPLDNIPIRTQVTRINQKYSESYVLLGLKIINLSNQNEALLSKFIHDAQVDELNRQSKDS